MQRAAALGGFLARRAAVCQGFTASYSYSQRWLTADAWAEVQVGHTVVKFEAGKYARLADGACVVTVGDTQVLATAVSDATFDETRDFLPLQVDYKEPGSASGQLPITSNRREHAFNEREVLCSRAVDRAVRPLFPPGFFYDTHVCAHVLSRGPAQDPDVLAINAASAALTLSSIPFSGPVGAVRVGQVCGQWVVNPTREQLEKSSLNLTYAGTATKALMVECIAKQVPESTVAAALQLAQDEAAKLIVPQQELARKLGRQKGSWQLLGATEEALEVVRALGEELVTSMLAKAEPSKHLRANQMAAARHQLLRRLQEKGFLGPGGEDGTLKRVAVNWAVEELEREALRKLALQGVRVDGRGTQQIRPIKCQSPVLAPAVHGSALFERGDTQSLASVTVASDRWSTMQLVSSATAMQRPFMLHYSFPPFAVNEVGKAAAASRREVGHGNLAERALQPVLPQDSSFPFTVRVNADTLMSNGSSSMAAVCAGSMALQDAGIPIEELVAGISVGLVTERYPLTMAGRVEEAPAGTAWPALEQYGNEALLTDIQGLEDHMGDMDFKVAGSRRGVTAMQLDTKLPGLPLETLVAALGAAREARSQLLVAMHEALQEGAPAEDEQPVHEPITINQELIGRLVGPEGTNLLKIEEEMGGRLTVCDTGEVHIWAPTKAAWDDTVSRVMWVEGGNLKQGEVYRVKVVRLLDLGAYVEVPGGMITLLHISELSHKKIRSIQEVLKEGQELEVKCLGKDARGMIRLSRKALLPTPKEQEPGQQQQQQQQQDVVSSYSNANRSASAEPLTRSQEARPHRHHPAPPKQKATAEGAA